jgi:hypothetical protein
MHFISLRTGRVASCVFAATLLAATSASAALRPGNYNVAGVQRICLQSGGTWYGETFAGWTGHWQVGPNQEDATLIFGNYANNVGNDSMVVTGAGGLDWTEWRDGQTLHTFIDRFISRINGTCTGAPPNAAPHDNPAD